MTEQQTIAIEVRHRYAASPERVFDAWLDPERARSWLFATPGGEIVAAEIDPRPGGRFRIVDRRGGEDIEHVGEYLEIDRPRRLVFRFGVPSIAPGDFDLVTVDLAPDGAGGCELTLRHDMDVKWAEEYLESGLEGWRMILDGLERTLGEGGRAAGRGAGGSAGGDAAAVGDG